MQTSKLYLLLCLVAVMTSAQNERNTSNVSSKKTELTKPKLTVSPSETVWEGDDVTLSCKSESKQLEQTKLIYTFYREKEPRSQIILQENKILSIQQSHAGMYWCMVEAKERTAERKESDKVQVTVNESPMATLTPSNTYVYIGDRVKLDCKIDGSFTGWKYRWYKRDKKARDEHFEKFTENTYKFEAVTESDSGVYLCSAYKADSPHFSKNSSAVTVTVEGRTAKLEMKAERTDGKIFEGDQVSLQCQVTGNPVGWTYELYKTTDKNQYETKAESTFTISSASLSHRGEYWCKAVKGTLYFSSSPVPLQVSESPMATLTPSNPYVYIGDKVKLDCKIDGSFTGWKYRWYKRDKKARDEHFEKFTENTYKFEAVTRSDSGVYLCSAYKADSPHFSKNSSAVTV
uniref:Ig-like domain-containing protein n=1 Tax=Erpetoichthys calabaricus TaxID=27687 RepID=A0A8C4XIM4_ERPCA